MRMLVVIGVCLFAVLGAAFMLSASRTPVASDGPVETLQPLEARLGRPFVMYVDGDVSPALLDALGALDTNVGALAGQVDVRTLLDLDVYVMVRDTWDVYRAIDNHDLGTAIRQQAQEKTENVGVTWFEASLDATNGTRRDVLVILAAKAGLRELSDFCLALAIYDFARFSGNGAAFVDATDGVGSHWKHCRARGWTSVADMALGGG